MSLNSGQSEAIAATTSEFETANSALSRTRADLDAANALIEDLQTQLAACQHPPIPDLASVQPRPVTEVIATMGVVMHLERVPFSNHLPQVISAVGGLGIKRGRCRIYRNNSALRDAMTQVASGCGLRFISNLGGPTGANTAAQMVAWLETFPPNVVAALEGDNEPNLGTNPNWAAASRQWMKDIAAAQATSPLKWVRDLPLAAPALGKRQGYEALGKIPEASHGNIHVYQGGLMANARLDDNVGAELQYVTPGKPVITTETGYHNAMANTTGTHRPTPLDVAGVYTPNIALESTLHPDVTGAFVYELMNEATNNSDQEDNFGLVFEDFSPKPAYTALADLKVALADPGTFTGPIEPIQGEVKGPQVVWLALANSAPGHYVFAIWRRVSIYDPDTGAHIAVPDADVSVRVGFDAIIGGEPISAGAPYTFPVGADWVPLPVVRT